MLPELAQVKVHNIRSELVETTEQPITEVCGVNARHGPAGPHSLIARKEYGLQQRKDIGISLLAYNVDSSMKTSFACDPPGKLTNNSSVG